MLTVAEAVKILSKKNITHSEEMVRRWIRKGKIKDAVKFSNKEGWLIPEDSLEEVIAAKTYMNSGIKSTKEYRKGYHLDSRRHLTRNKCKTRQIKVWTVF